MRRFSRLLLIALVAVVAGFYPLLAPMPHRIDPAHFDLIQNGMTQADVEAIFGVPPGQYDWAESSPVVLLSYKASFRTAMVGSLVKYRTAIATGGGSALRLKLTNMVDASESWISRHGLFTVYFNQGRVVSRSGPNPVRIVPPWQRWWKAIWER
jgi:hypothetical protein